MVYYYLMQRVNINHFKHKKIGLVLSGGVVKAASWHLGVAIALEELGFNFVHNDSDSTALDISTYVGSSAGSLIGLYLASGFGPLDIVDATPNKKGARIPPIGYRDMLSIKKRLKGHAKKYKNDPLEGLPLIVKQLMKPILGISGFFTTEGLRDYIIKHLINSEHFEDYKADLFVVATQLDHSRKVIFSKYNYPNPGHDVTAEYYTKTSIADAVAASMSVPPFYSPFPIENRQNNQVEYYIDGEIRETLSTHVAIDNRCDFIINSWTHTPYHFHDEVGSLVHYGLPAICVQAIHLLVEKKIITARSRRNAAADVIDTINDFMKSHRFNDKERKKLLSLLERKLHFRPDVHFIDIYPKHEDYKTFFTNSFSLNPNKTSAVVSAGHKRTMEIFKNHEWES